MCVQKTHWYLRVQLAPTKITYVLDLASKHGINILGVLKSCTSPLHDAQSLRLCNMIALYVRAAELRNGSGEQHTKEHVYASLSAQQEITGVLVCKGCLSESYSVCGQLGHNP